MIDDGSAIAHAPKGFGDAGRSGLDRVFVEEGIRVVDELVHDRVYELMLRLPRVDVDVSVAFPAIAEGRLAVRIMRGLYLAQYAEGEVRLRVFDRGRVRLGAGLAHRRRVC